MHFQNIVISCPYNSNLEKATVTCCCSKRKPRMCAAESFRKQLSPRLQESGLPNSDLGVHTCPLFTRLFPWSLKAMVCPYSLYNNCQWLSLLVELEVNLQMSSDDIVLCLCLFYGTQQKNIKRTKSFTTWNARSLEFPRGQCAGVSAHQSL